MERKGLFTIKYLPHITNGSAQTYPIRSKFSQAHGLPCAEFFAREICMPMKGSPKMSRIERDRAPDGWCVKGAEGLIESASACA